MTQSFISGFGLSVRRLSPPCRFVAGVLVAFLAVAIGTGGRAHAADPEVFAVRGVAVDATAATAAKARLVARLVRAADQPRVSARAPDAINDLVRDFEVADEKTSAVRYLASLTVRFRPDAVRTFLRGQGVGFAETRSKPLLVLPVYELSGALSLWDDPNPWREAWSRLPASDGLVPLVRARGDLQDIAAIGAEQAVRGDDARLKAIAGRHGASDVLIARAGMRYPDGPPVSGGSGPWLQVSLSRFGNALLEQTRVEAFYPEAGEDQNALLARAAVAIAGQIEENWKRNNRLRFDTGDELTVEVPITSLAQWLEIKTKVEAVPFIRRADLIYLSRKLARLRLNFIGDAEQLRLALSQSDLALEAGPTSLILRPGRVGAGERKGDAVNVPNLITLARLLSVPILVWSIVDGRMMFAFLLFIAAGASDALDGFIAKRFGAETELGRFLDPLADKALLVGIYLALWSQQHLPNWLVLLVVWRDLLIVGGALLYQLLTHNLKMEPLLISKFNTLMQILLAAFILGMNTLGMENALVLNALIWAVALSTVLSGATYVIGWVRKAATMEGNP